jgi:hypothetical protein
MNNQNIIALPASVNYTPEQALLSALDQCAANLAVQGGVKSAGSEAVHVFCSLHLNPFVGIMWA